MATAATSVGEETVVLRGEEPGASQHSMLVAGDSYEELDYDLSVDDNQVKRRLKSGTIAEIVENDDVLPPSVPVGELINLELEVFDEVPQGDCADGVDRVNELIAEVNELSMSQETNERVQENELNSEAEASAPAASEEEEMRIRSGSMVDKVQHTERGQVVEDICTTEWKQQKKHVFVFSDAGKPIYSRYGKEDKLNPLMGVMLTLVSFVQLEKDTLRSFRAGNHLYVFLLRQPLILVAVSKTSESQQQLLMQLTYVYNHIISVLTYSRISSIFKKRDNYDLRKLLGGTEIFLDNLIQLMDHDPCFLLTAIRCLPLDSTIRDMIGSAMHSAKVKDLVFAILIADNQLVTLVRMKKYILHPADLHLILNLLNKSTSFKHSDSWLPICLPKFDSSGFLHAHISYLSESPACLVLLTVDKMAFAEMAKCKEKILERLQKNNCIAAIQRAVSKGSFRCQEVGIGDLRHFLYKVRSTAQYAAPELDAPYNQPDERDRLLSLYQYTHQRIHSPARPLKIMFTVGSKEAVLGWVTGGFELFAIFGPLTTKQAAIFAVNKLLKWIKKEETRLFILNPPEY
ncbi:protein SAND-like [Lytechinus variegatus]|uniref:protein SAND-like n=1 Tax=Lytechinus variegatus TaxID=7654 RepID=UPI001BB1ADBD|nr:protein SAND-like [Lytechinus variegatus]